MWYACVKLVVRGQGRSRLVGVALLLWKLPSINVCRTRMALAASLRFEKAKKAPSMSKAQAMQLERVRVSPIIMTSPQ